MFYTIYKADTGEILWSGSCVAEDFDKQEVPPGCSISDALTQHDAQYIDVKTKLPVNIPEAPSEFHDWDISSKQWIQRSGSEILEILWSRVRFIRDKMLTEVDWTQLPDVPSGLKESFANYRQALRDITSQSNPTEIVWPTPPSGWVSKVVINY